VIPKAHITHWAAGAPWPSELQVEQDLILSRLIIDIANHDLLGLELAFRGGTCLHKLHLPTALRYSDDLDYVRTTHGPVGAVVDALRDVTTAVGLEERSRKIRPGMATYVCRAAAENGGVIRIKIETNVEEAESFLDRERLPYTVISPWFEGRAEVATFALDELMATKLRAIYQRRKGRDLFDLWHALVALDTDDARIVAGLEHYMRDNVFTYPQLAQNLRAKIQDADFAADLDALVTTRPEDYVLHSAADLVMERLGSRLRNAPSLDDVRDGAWRA
jgi:predicted nucleotidyltransferase component of viral defense system